MGAYSFGIFLLITHLLYIVNGKIEMEEIPTYNVTTEVCSNVRMEFNYNKVHTMCKPRMVVVKLKAEPGYTYFPNVVSVKRCHGFCYNNLSCMSSSSKLTSVFVKRQHITSSIFTCHRVFVEEHEECNCMCDVMEKHCNKYQMYSQRDCACKCTNMHHKQKCNAMADRKWNPETCSCMCDIPEQECSTGLRWITEYCKCVRDMSGNDIME